VSALTTLKKNSDVKKARKQLRGAGKNASKTVAPVAADARDATVRAADATRDWAAPKVETAVDWAAPKMSSAKDWAAPHVDSAKDWAAPMVEPAVDKVTSDVLPVVAGAIASALAATEPQRAEIADRGAAALAALRGEVTAPSRKKHRVRKFFLLAGAVGAAWAGWKAWLAKKQDPVDAWTTPSSAIAPSAPVGTVTAVGSTPAATPTTATPTTDDPGGAGPDEALADAVDEATAVEDGSPAATEPVTEEVTPSNAKKVSDAASKGATKKS
jgi:hypothetical protein